MRRRPVAPDLASCREASDRRPDRPRLRRAGSKYQAAGGAALIVHKALRSPVLTFVIALAVLASAIASADALALRRWDATAKIPGKVTRSSSSSCAAALDVLRGVWDRRAQHVTGRRVERRASSHDAGANRGRAGAHETPGRALTCKPDVIALRCRPARRGAARERWLRGRSGHSTAERLRGPVRCSASASRSAGTPASFTSRSASRRPWWWIRGCREVLRATRVVTADPVPIPPRLFSAIALMAVTNSALIRDHPPALLHGVGPEARLHLGLGQG